MDIKDLKDVDCTCGNKEFIQTFMVKRVPALYSQTGKEQVGPIPARFVCTSCGKDVYDSFMETSEPEKSNIII